MSIKRGVSLISYQQSQFVGEIDLQGQIEEIGRNLYGANGVEIISEMSLRYPDPREEFYAQWAGWLQESGVVPVTMDVFWDVLQFRDHVMSLHEGAQRLIDDLRLARRLGISNVKVPASHQFEVMREALVVAEELDVRILKEIQQPMTLDGPEVTEIMECVERTGTRHLGFVLDGSLFQVRPFRVRLCWLARHGVNSNACELAMELADSVESGNGLLGLDDVPYAVRGIPTELKRFLEGTAGDARLDKALAAIKEAVDALVTNASEADYGIVAELLSYSRTSPGELADVIELVHGVHGKCFEMTEVPERPGSFEEVGIDYAQMIGGLLSAGYTGYVNTEYEGQRFFQDGDPQEMRNEVEQVRRHQQMLVELAAG